MRITMTTYVVAALAIVMVIAIAIAIFKSKRKARTLRLHVKFGTEYDRLLETPDRSASTAEAMLDERQKRVDKFNIRNLTAQESGALTAEWRSVQQNFVDEPRVAVWRADALLNRALLARGYPMANFEQQAADMSVERSEVVSNYRIAHEIAVRDQHGKATTEELRQAMQHYRTLLERALETNAVSA